jgi:hypothetical protein
MLAAIRLDLTFFIKSQYREAAIALIPELTMIKPEGSGRNASNRKTAAISADSGIYRARSV